MIQAAYLHIPFCEHICHYCDFNKVFLQGQPVDEYLHYLDKEMAVTLNRTEHGPFKTIFVGGGTPTALNEKQLAVFLDSIRKRLPLAEDYEFTFEANPGDLSYEKLKLLYDNGVNRLSLGVQTFNDQLLEKIGRVHRVKDVYQSLESAKKAGFRNMSIDLIYSLPGQTLADFRETLNEALQLDVQHYSAYSLIIEPKTVFYNLMRKGKLRTPGEDVEAAMYELLMEKMTENGFNQYEISNFSKPEFESKHNLTYWNNEAYFGFGAGAHSYVDGQRRSNYGPLKKYMAPLDENELPLMDIHEVTKKEKMEEEMFLGLRKTAGVSMKGFKDKYAIDVKELFREELLAHEQKSLIEIKDDDIRLTKQGRLLGNEVFQSFIK